MQVKAITIYEPWASLVALGAKKIETRSWPTKYRGSLAIHAAKTIRSEYMNLVWQEPFFSALNPLIESANGGEGFHFHLGCIVAIAQLVGCQKIFPGNAPWGYECEFGDYRVGRYMWFLDDVRRLEKPIPIRGQQGLWEWGGSEGGAR